MLVNISLDSLRRNPIRCGIDAKVRRKNEIARDLKKKFWVLIRMQGILGRNPSVWRIKPECRRKQALLPMEKLFSLQKNSIFRLKIHICNLKICICSLKIRIFSLKIENNQAISHFIQQDNEFKPHKKKDIPHARYVFFFYALYSITSIKHPL